MAGTGVGQLRILPSVSPVCCRGTSRCAAWSRAFLSTSGVLCSSTQACKPRNASVAPAPCCHQQNHALHLGGPQLTPSCGRASTVLTQARRDARDPWGDSEDASPSSSGRGSRRSNPGDGAASSKQWGFAADGRGVKLQVNGTEVSVPQENLWQLAVPAAMVLGLAAVIGPLVIGLAMAAVAVGAALSMGAVALSFLWLPFAMMFGLMLLSFGGLSFGLFATFGLGLFLPKLISFMVAAGGMGLGWLLFRNVLPGSASRRASPAASSPGRGAALDETVPADSRSLDESELTEGEKEIKRMSAELRDFDSLLAEREEARRVAEWRRGTRG